MKVVLASVVIGAIALFSVYQETVAQDCNGHVVWVLNVCPHGEGWECYRHGQKRDVNCPEKGWGNYTDFANTRGFGWCHCCGRCRVPENLYA